MPHAREMVDGPGTPGRQPTEGRQRAASAGSGPQGQTITQTFALVVGVVYLLVGVVGFAVTGFTGVTSDGADKLIGFDLNVFHNVVHLAIGAGFIAVSRLDATITQGVVIGAGPVYLGAAAVLFGLLGVRQSTCG